MVRIKEWGLEFGTISACYVLSLRLVYNGSGGTAHRKARQEFSNDKKAPPAVLNATKLNGRNWKRIFAIVFDNSEVEQEKSGDILSRVLAPAAQKLKDLAEDAKIGVTESDPKSSNASFIAITRVKKHAFGSSTGTAKRKAQTRFNSEMETLCNELLGADSESD